jgi:hypothetical protein
MSLVTSETLIFCTTNAPNNKMVLTLDGAVSPSLLATCPWENSLSFLI